jgi:hypothetical protein
MIESEGCGRNRSSAPRLLGKIFFDFLRFSSVLVLFFACSSFFCCQKLLDVVDTIDLNIALVNQLIMANP